MVQDGMRYRELHRWDVTPREAAAIQEKLRGRVRERPLARPVRTVAGADVSYDKRAGLVYAAVVLMSWPELEVLETSTAARRGRFPYVPGLLTFREGPALLEAFGRLPRRPGLIFFDGQGRAHPRRLGLASHLGLALGVPSIGCAKSRLTGHHALPRRVRGARADLVDEGEVVGTVLRTRAGVRPIYVSVGHLITLEEAAAWCLASARRYRLPEPAREAHRLVTALRSEAAGG